MTTHIKKVLEPVHNGSSKTVVYIIYGALGLILTIVILAFNNAECAKNEAMALKCTATKNETNIVTLKEQQKDVVVEVKELRKEMNTKLDEIMKRVK